MPRHSIVKSDKIPTGAGFLGHVPEAKRCQAKSQRSGERCNNPAAHTTRVCRMHGAGNRRSKAKGIRRKIEDRFQDGMNRAQPSDLGSIEGAPLVALDAEMRRTVGHIDFLESQIAELSREQLVWGFSLEELHAAGLSGKQLAEFAVKQGGKAHPAIELLQVERVNLRRLLAILLGRGVQARKLELEKEHVDRFVTAIDAVVRGLGSNPKDPAVRVLIRDALRTL